MARILIDGRFVGVGESVSRYTLELVKGILELDHTNSYTLLLRPIGIKEAERFLKLDIPFSNWQEKSETNIKYKKLNTKYSNLHLQVLDISHYSFGEQTKLLRYLNEEKFDLVHFTQFNHPLRYHGKYVITIHDLTMIGHLHRNLPHKRIAYRLAMKSAIRNSAKIIAISKTTKDELLEFYKVPKEKIKVIYHGLDHKNYNLAVRSRTGEIKKFEEKYEISDEYILYTGMWKRHKNILRMLKAFEQFRIQNTDNRIQLVLVGKIDKKEPEVLREIEQINNITIKQYNNKAIIATGFVEEEELPIAYAGAFVYCIPSFSEGFGWPPLEAMACGTPVIASGESSIPEICGKAPLYFDAYNISDIAKKMEIVTTNKELRKKMIKKGLEQVQKYHWNKTAEETFEIYKGVILNSCC